MQGLTHRRLIVLPDFDGSRRLGVWRNPLPTTDAEETHRDAFILAQARAGATDERLVADADHQIDDERGARAIGGRLRGGGSDLGLLFFDLLNDLNLFIGFDFSRGVSWS